jgi:hypothetical protein
MFSFQSLLNLIGVMLSLTPFLGVGYYFGRLEKRISTLEKTTKVHTEKFIKLGVSV